MTLLWLWMHSCVRQRLCALIVLLEPLCPMAQVLCAAARLPVPRGPGGLPSAAAAADCCRHCLLLLLEFRNAQWAECSPL